MFHQVVLIDHKSGLLKTQLVSLGFKSATKRHRVWREFPPPPWCRFFFCDRMKWLKIKAPPAAHPDEPHTNARFLLLNFSKFVQFFKLLTESIAFLYTRFSLQDNCELFFMGVLFLVLWTGSGMWHLGVLLKLLGLLLFIYLFAFSQVGESSPLTPVTRL